MEFKCLEFENEYLVNVLDEKVRDQFKEKYNMEVTSPGIVPTISYHLYKELKHHGITIENYMKKALIEPEGNIVHVLVSLPMLKNVKKALVDENNIVVHFQEHIVFLLTEYIITYEKICQPILVNTRKSFNKYDPIFKLKK